MDLRPFSDDARLKATVHPIPTGVVQALLGFLGQHKTLDRI